MSSLLLPFASVFAVSALSFLGVLTLSMSVKTLQRFTFVLVSLAVGALLGDAFIHLIPEAFETAADPLPVSLLIIGGALAFFGIEKFLHWHHHGNGHHHDRGVHPTGPLILVSDGIHNLTDGLIIGASYFVSVPVGIATTIAVMLHEIPQEFGDFGVLLHAGYTKTRALLLNFVSGLFAVLGLLVALLLGADAQAFTAWVLPLAAGGFVYVAMSDLVPELQKTRDVGRSLIQLITILVGVTAMVLLLGLE